MDKLKSFLLTFGVLNENESVSITNLAVYLFLFITAFKAMFAGVVIDLKYIDWKIESLDVSSTLPLLFSLINYGHKREQTIKFNQVKEEKNESKAD